MSYELFNNAVEDVAVGDVGEDDVTYSDGGFLDKGDGVLATLNKGTHTNATRGEDNLLTLLE